VASPQPGAESWTLLAGVRRLATSSEPTGQTPAPARWWEPVAGITLPAFVAWVLEERVVVQRALHRADLRATFWTAPDYVALERELAQIDALQAEEERTRLRLAQGALSERIKEQLEEQQIAALEAAKDETRRARGSAHSGIPEPRRAAIRTALDAWSVSQDLTDLQVVFGAGAGAAHWAGGSAVLAAGRPVGTLMPAPQLLGDLDSVDGMVLFATSYTEARDLAHCAAEGSTIVRLQGTGVRAVDGIADFLVSGPFVTADAERLQREAAGTPRQPESRDSMLWAVALLFQELRRARTGDLDVLYRVAGRLGEMAGAGLLDQEAVCRATVVVARNAGWPPVTADGMQDLEDAIRGQVAASAAYQRPAGSLRRLLLG
jgi:hypothetical protein